METTVVFADILGGADLIARAGDAAAVAALGACFVHLKNAAEGCGARVINRAADKLMILLPTPDAAADAAAAMHSAMETLPQAGETKLALGIGFHHGPVTQKDNEVWGDTVNLAAQLVEQAANGQIITTRETASHFSCFPSI
jgi:adenylate cyclase